MMNEDYDWEIDLDDLFTEAKPSYWGRIKAFVGRLFKKKEDPDTLTEEDLPSSAELQEAFLARSEKVMVAQKIEEALCMTEWEPREAIDEAPGVYTGVVTRVVAVTVDDENEWTLVIYLTPKYTNGQPVVIPLAEFFSDFVPTGPLTFRKYDA